MEHHQSLVQQILRAGANPDQVRSALTSNVSPLVADHHAMSSAMRLVAGNREALLEEMKLDEAPLSVYREQYPTDLDDSLASGWTIALPKHH